MLGEFIDEYRELHRRRPGVYGKGPAEAEVKVLRGLVERFGLLPPSVRRVVDWGCGNSTLLVALWPGFEPVVEKVYYDPAVPGRDAEPEGVFDVLTCTDVLEHIPEHELDGALESQGKLSPVRFYIVHTGKAHNVLPSGRNCHCTVREPGWWKEKLTAGATAFHEFSLPRPQTYGVVVWA